MKGDIPKQFLLLSGRPVLVHTVYRLSESVVDDLLVLVPEERLDFTRSLVEKDNPGKPIKVIAGGAERQDSVRYGLNALGPDCSLVLIHDGVRPFVRPDAVNAVIEAARKSGAATLALMPTDTIKMRDEATGRMSNLARERLVMIQTPQAFRRDLIEEAHRKALAEGYTATDDSDLVERIGHEVVLVDGDPLNIKITSREDLVLAEAVLEKRVKAWASA